MIFTITDPAACKQHKHAALGPHFVLHLLQVKDITLEVLKETLAEAQSGTAADCDLSLCRQQTLHTAANPTYMQHALAFHLM